MDVPILVHTSLRCPSRWHTLRYLQHIVNLTLGGGIRQWQCDFPLGQVLMHFCLDGPDNLYSRSGQLLLFVHVPSLRFRRTKDNLTRPKFV